jgi:photolyase PhrII
MSNLVVLPPHLAERLEPAAPSPAPQGKYVMCWLRVSVRAHENPALDVAVTAATQLGLPCFVYWAIDERYPFASDRLHTFALEGARDLQRDLRERGVGAVFHVATPNDRRPHLRALAERAALVITDMMPTAPFPAWDRAVASAAPLWRVDASCVAPMWALKKHHTRAFTFRQEAEPWWRRHDGAPWNDADPAGPVFVPDDVDFSLDLQTVNLPALVASCAIDHGVGPVHHTVGGRRAGLARWQRFLRTGINGYARRRNDPLVDGVSRMSAYLHFGHVSPFQLVREARAVGGDGAEKFLDELLTWRELGWHLCLHEPAHQTTAALPTWATTTLREHERDERPHLSWEQLARAQTGDALWDACQRSLLVNGELHNNLRMTWGKALPSWTPDAETALARLFDLNNRYALDGRDPSSVSGILWCLGALDRPFTPTQPILGTVRPRPLAAHAARLDVRAYAKQVQRPSRGQPLRVAVVGAGVAGAACARTLVDAGHDVAVLDKGRGPGGRCSTRSAAGDRRFDHGAQFFTASDERFGRFVESWRHDGIVAPWTPRMMQTSSSSSSRAPEQKWVAVPGMSALLKRMLLDVSVQFGVRVRSIAADHERYRCTSDDGRDLGIYDAVVVAVPGPQAAPLLANIAPTLSARAALTPMDATWAVLVDYEGLGPNVDADVIQLRGRALRWAAREASKPGRAPGARWVLHGHCADDDPAHAIATLVADFVDVVGASAAQPAFSVAHLWRYAFVERAVGSDCLVDDTGRVVACGDWCMGPRIEAAYLSGVAAAGRLLSLR